MLSKRRKRLSSPRAPSPARLGRRGREPRASRRVDGAFNLPIGCGVDVVELARLKQAIRRGKQAFMRRIFTSHEAAYARARRRTTLLHLAGRFAAKEAVLKAISQVDPKRMPAMSQVEIRNDRLGRPRVVLLDGRANRLQVCVSLSHVDSVAVASAIVVKR